MSIPEADVEATRLLMTWPQSHILSVQTARLAQLESWGGTRLLRWWQGEGGAAAPLTNCHSERSYQSESKRENSYFLLTFKKFYVYVYTYWIAQKVCMAFSIKDTFSFFY